MGNRARSRQHAPARVSRRPQRLTVCSASRYSLSVVWLAMNALSRREEETLLKKTKEHALKECDPIVKGEALRVHSRTCDPKLTWLRRICRVRRGPYIHRRMEMQGEV